MTNNYTEVLSSIRAVSKDVTLLSVSKTHPYEAVLSAYESGCRLFGENRVQEVEEKFPLPENREKDMKVFLIGHLQSNKVKKAVRLFDRIESVDSLELLKKIDLEAGKIGKRIDVLLELNSSGESQKSGFISQEALLEAAEVAQNLKNIKLIGIMTVGPLGGDDSKNREAFNKTKGLYDSIKDRYNLNVLSMGMSGDWRSAIECGSTEVRIGSAIFGQRNYSV